MSYICLRLNLAEFCILHTYLSSLFCTGAVVMEVGWVGKAVEVQLRLTGVVKLQPSVVSVRGRVISRGGGYILDPMLTQRDTINPDIRPDTAP